MFRTHCLFESRVRKSNNKHINIYNDIMKLWAKLFRPVKTKWKNDSYRRDNRKNKRIVGQNNPKARGLVKQQNAPLLKYR